MHPVEVYDIVIFAVRDNQTADMNKAPWSSGQDASLSRWNQGFDSPRSHLESPFLRAFSCLENKSVSNGVSNIRLDIEESKILKEEILDVFLSRSIKLWLFLWFDGKIKEKKG